MQTCSGLIAINAFAACAFTLTCVFPTASNAQSADCDSPIEIYERVVCDDDDLLDLDTEMAESFNELKTLLWHDMSTFAPIRDEHHSWKVERQNCGFDTECLTELYEDHIEYLDELLEDFGGE